MFGFELKPFEASHITLSKLRAQERDFLKSLGGLDAVAAFLVRIEDAPSWSIFKNGEFISAAGVLTVYHGVGETWQLPSLMVADHMVSYCKIFRHFTSMILSDGPYRRLQTTCVHDDLHCRWMEFIGFKKEGVLRQFGTDGKDHAIFARLKDGT